MENFSLSAFNALVKKTLSQNLEPSYWIVAEIGEINLHSSGHCYLTLVEKQETKVLAKMRATIWSFTFRNIHAAFVKATGSPLQSGMNVLFNASLDFHEIYGMSLNIRDIDPGFTLGEREKARQETISLLEKEGVIDLNKSLGLTAVPDRIALISSETAAGYGDFMDQIMGNPYGYRPKVKLYAATMQGDLAAGSIIECLDQIAIHSMQFDAVAIIRGGGAKTDLDCFDDYQLCAKIAQFGLPVITGIGHERDETIADLVAHVSLKTPTAVAEFIISAMLHFESEIQIVAERMSRRVNEIVDLEKHRVKDIQYQIQSRVENTVQSQIHQLNLLISLFSKKPLDIVNQELTNLALLEKLFESHHPNKILDRGFTLTKVNGRYLSQTSDIKVGDQLETDYSAGKLLSTINSEKNE